MKYSIELLRAERDKLKKEYDEAINKEIKDWEVICRNEPLIQELSKSIDMLFMMSFDMLFT
jgi:hypothetical protein